MKLFITIVFVLGFSLAITNEDLCQNSNLEVRSLIKTSSGLAFMFTQHIISREYKVFEFNVQSNFSIDFSAHRPSLRSFPYFLFSGPNNSFFEQAIEIPNSNSAFIFYSINLNYRKVVFDTITKQWHHDLWVQWPSWCGRQHGFCVLNSMNFLWRIHLNSFQNIIPYERLKLVKGGYIFKTKDEGYMALTVNSKDNQKAQLLFFDMNMPTKIIEDDFKTNLITAIFFTETNKIHLFSKTKTAFYGQWNGILNKNETYTNIPLKEASFKDYFQCYRQPNQLLNVKKGQIVRSQAFLKKDNEDDKCKLGFISIFIVLIAFNIIVFVLFSLLYIISK